MAEPSAKAIHLILVDDHAMFREGLARVLERESDLMIVGEYASATDALSSLGELDVEVVLK
jgi:DNA-binding NarL/FixJ family response regulator